MAPDTRLAIKDDRDVQKPTQDFLAFTLCILGEVTCVCFRTRHREARTPRQIKVSSVAGLALRGGRSSPQRRHAVVCLHSRARQLADSYGGMSNFPLRVIDKNPKGK